MGKFERILLVIVLLLDAAVAYLYITATVDPFLF